jgi:hypothetical protein
MAAIHDQLQNALGAAAERLDFDTDLEFKPMFGLNSRRMGVPARHSSVEEFRTVMPTLSL